MIFGLYSWSHRVRRNGARRPRSLLITNKRKSHTSFHNYGTNVSDLGWPWTVITLLTYFILIL